MIIYKSNIFVIEKNSQTSKIESKKGKKKVRGREREKEIKNKREKSLNYY